MDEHLDLLGPDLAGVDHRLRDARDEPPPGLDPAGRLLDGDDRHAAQLLVAGAARAASVRQSGEYQRRSSRRNSGETEPGETRSVRPASPSAPRVARTATTP